MKLLSKTIGRNGDLLFWWCPGCGCAHCINFVNDIRPAWSWNGDAEKPTLHPSVLSTGQKRCHCFVRDGKIEFLNDCTHDLKGQTVGIPDWPFKEEK